MSKFIPNSFQVPNAVVDEFLAKLSGNAFKCYALIARQTTGWQKQSDRISISQFMAKCGIKNRKTAFSCLAELEEIQLIKTFKSNGEITEFSLNFEFDDMDDEPVPKNNTSTKNYSGPVPKNNTSTSTKNWDSTKDTIKNNITKNNNIVRAVQNFEVHFEQFWQAGLVKVNKQKSLKSFKSAYESYHAEYPTTLAEFTRMLIDDIRKRLALHQYGFDKLHPTTYLNNRRWLDEYPTVATSPQNSTASTKPNAHVGFAERDYGTTDTPDWAKDLV